MDTITSIFGEGRELTVLQMCARAVVVYFITLLYIRLAGRRVFGKISTFDYVIIFTLGALLSRAIVGVSPFLPVVASAMAFILLHRFVAWLCVVSPAVGRIVKGRPVCLYSQGKFNEKNMKQHLITERDAMEVVRKELGSDNLDDVEEINLERSGELSVLRKRR